MKSKHFFPIIIAVVFLGATTLNAQGLRRMQSNEQTQKPFIRGGEKSDRFVNLTDEQKTILRDLHTQNQKESKTLHLDLQTQKAKQKTLVESASPDMKAIEKNIEEIAKTEAQLAKIRVAHHLEMRKVLPDNSSFGMQQGFGRFNNAGNMGPAKSGVRGPQAKMSRQGQRGPEKQFMGDNGRIARQQMLKKRMVLKQKGQMAKRQNPGKVKTQGIERISQETRDMIKSDMLTVSAATRNNRNKLNELRVAQKALLTAENVDIKAVNKNIDEMTKIKSDIMKTQLNHRVNLLQKLDAGEREMVLMAREKHSNKQRGFRF